MRAWTMTAVVNSESHGKTTLGKISLRLARCLFGEVEHRGRADRGGPAAIQQIGHMLVFAAAAGCNHGNPNSRSNIPHQIDVIAAHRAVTVDRSEQDLAGAERFNLFRPLDRITARGGTAAVAHDLDPAAIALHVDRNHDALRAELGGAVANKLRSLDGGGVDRDLVGADRE